MQCHALIEKLTIKRVEYRSNKPPPRAEGIEMRHIRRRFYSVLQQVFSFRSQVPVSLYAHFNEELTRSEGREEANGDGGGVGGGKGDRDGDGDGAGTRTGVVEMRGQTKDSNGDGSGDGSGDECWENLQSANEARLEDMRGGATPTSNQSSA